MTEAVAGAVTEVVVVDVFFTAGIACANARPGAAMHAKSRTRATEYEFFKLNS